MLTAAPSHNGSRQPSALLMSCSGMRHASTITSRVNTGTAHFIILALSGWEGLRPSPTESLLLDRGSFRVHIQSVAQSPAKTTPDAAKAPATIKARVGIGSTWLALAYHPEKKAEPPKANNIPTGSQRLRIG